MENEIIYHYTEKDLKEVILEREYLASKAECFVLSSLWILILLYCGDKLIQFVKVSKSIISFDTILLSFIIIISLIAEIKYALILSRHADLDLIENDILEEINNIKY